MSRHRYVKNLNIADELDDDALSDGGEDMTAEQQAQMASALIAVRQIIGSDVDSGIVDSKIMDTLWNHYFDVQECVKWLLEDQERLNTSKELKAAKEREKAQKLAGQRNLASLSIGGSRATFAIPTASTKGKEKRSLTGPSGLVKVDRAQVDQRQMDISALNLDTNEPEPVVYEAPPAMTLAREHVMEEAKKALEGSGGRQGLSLVVIGHVDAGKSTLMGRLLYELGLVEEKSRIANERASSKAGKSSFSWAWQMDGTIEERSRGITMDIGKQSLVTAHRQITILDAPGHKDFIPNMISGAAEADCALLVVDSSTGEFEAGFDKGGQTREHLLLVRSLGVAQVVIAVNKLDQVKWQKDRYEDICEQLRPFLVQAGFHPKKTKFVPVGAASGVNLVSRNAEEAKNLREWYDGPSLIDLLDVLEPPQRAITAPLRFPVSNVFKGSGSGTALAGRICGGVMQVGERVRILPGDQTGVVKSIEADDQPVEWAAAGQNITINLVDVDPIALNIGSILCPPTALVPLVTRFSARIIVFDIELPLAIGASIELFHQSSDVPATISKIIATLDRTTGAVVKANPRVLTKMVSAKIEITLRSTSKSSIPQSIPMEPFALNKDMGRILLRRQGETVGAGVVLTNLE